MDLADFRISWRAVLLFAAVAVSLPLVAGFFGRLHPAFDSLAHFRAHLAVVLAVLALALLGLRGWSEGFLALALTMGAFATTTPALTNLLAPQAHAAIKPLPGDRAVYRLLQLNLYYENWDPGSVLSMIGRIRPDVVTLNEVSPEWKARLDLLQNAYPYRIVCPVRKAIGGVAILSRRPFAAGTEPGCFDRGSMAVAIIDLGGQAVHVTALHLGWPWPFGQHWQVGNVSPVLAATPGPALLAGDFNAAPWSATSQAIAAAGGLTPVSVPGATWLHHRLPLWLHFAGLPIDQVMTKGDIDIH
jgi:endonuclease/exonuclease/phosphatase (EEP) superfamily protein YafD